MLNVNDIRIEIWNNFLNKNFVIDKTGVKTIEIIGATFLADEPVIFGSTDFGYVKREIEWYESQSLNVNDIPGQTPQIWKQVADINGFINSNYGYLVFSKDNFNQYENVLEELRKNRFTRRASMIYNRPSIWNEYDKNGMSDFICTYAHNYFIRNDKLHVHVLMRSSDMVFGYKNDYYWAKYVLEKLGNDLDIEIGDIIWTASSLHIYERHFKLISDYFTGK